MSDHDHPGPVDLRARCHDPELMDDPDCPAVEVDQALRELSTIGRLPGGTATSLAALAPFLRAAGRPVRLLDFGTGGADLPTAVVRWCRREGVPIQVIALDLGRQACRFARRATHTFPEIDVVRADVFSIPFAGGVFDLAHCSLFLHHFRQEEIATILTRVAACVRVAIVINDLQRNALSYHAVRLLTRCFSKSRLVRYDGPLSVRRAFSAADLDDLARRSGFSDFTYRRHWACRWIGLARTGV